MLLHNLHVRFGLKGISRSSFTNTVQNSIIGERRLVLLSVAIDV